jgi:phosphoribosylformylglycinamidine synthase
MGTRIEVMTRGSVDTKRSSKGLISKRPIRVYNIDDDLEKEEIEAVQNLLADPIVDLVSANRSVLLETSQEEGILAASSCFIEASPKPGVNDPEGKEAKRAIEQIIGRELKGGVSFAKQYLWQGALSEEEYERLKKQLGNPLINGFRFLDSKDFSKKLGMGFYFPEVNLPPVEPFRYIDINLDDDGLMGLSDSRLLALNLEEMKTIRDLFKDPNYITERRKAGLGEKITDAELEALAQTWSEHCCHKKFNAKWIYISGDPNDESGLSVVTDSVFKSIIKESTEKIIKEGRTKLKVISVFKDNAGVVALNDKYNFAHKVETHNHPSALDGEGGAGTGIGGVIRDTLGTGIGMEPVSSQAIFGFPLPGQFTDLPSDIQSPERTIETVINGVEGYGNKMGLPTQCVRVLFDAGWIKPSIYVGSTAVAPAQIKGRYTHVKEVKPGYIGISLGGKVGKDGIHGATASSDSLASNAEKRQDVNQSVQIGGPIVEKGVVEVMKILWELGYIEATQDCGAGGLNSALGELAEFSNGAVVDLSNVPEKYKGLTGWEKLVSEAQERMIIVIKPEYMQKVLEICKHNNVDATKIADFNDSGFYKVIDQNQTIAYLPMDFMHQGLPQMTIKARYIPCQNKEPELPKLEDLTESFLQIMSRPNMQIYDWIITRFDHEVRGGSLIKPLVGIGKGKSDAIAYRPVLTEKEIVMESVGSNPWQGDIDAYHMGRNSVVDAIGKIIAAGGDLERIAFNGNTTCPKPEKDPYVAAQVMRMLKGAADAEVYFGTPTISGKDSTSMERSYTSTVTGKEVNLKAKPELLKSALGIVQDDSTITTSDFKLAGDLIYVIGETKDELGASEYYLMNGETGRNVPKSDFDEIKKRYVALSAAIKAGLIHSAQYVSKGGLAAAIANSTIGGDLGASVLLDDIDEKLYSADKVLFSETTGRFVVSVHPSKRDEFEEIMKGFYAKNIGVVRPDRRFAISYHNDCVVSAEVNELREKNRATIRF